MIMGPLVLLYPAYHSRILTKTPVSCSQTKFLWVLEQQNVPELSRGSAVWDTLIRQKEFLGSDDMPAASRSVVRGSTEKASPLNGEYALRSAPESYRRILSGYQQCTLGKY